MAAPDEKRASPDLALPADVPPEFGDAYRAAYTEALGEPERPTQPPSETTAHRRAPAASELGALWSETWVKATIAGLAAIVLVLGAYGIGKAFSSEEGGPADEPTAGASTGSPSNAHPYEGKVSAVRVGGVTASCTAPPGMDAGGRPVSYRPGNTLDRDPSTAWRCDGRGVGETMTFALPKGTRVAEVGLVPGYAKTDPVNGMDRYAQNNRITKVRWTIGDRRVVQHFSAHAEDRSLRTIRIAVTEADRVRVTILATVRGPRNTTAISTVELASPQD